MTLVPHREVDGEDEGDGRLGAGFAVQDVAVGAEPELPARMADSDARRAAAYAAGAVRRAGLFDPAISNRRRSPIRAQLPGSPLGPLSRMRDEALLVERFMTFHRAYGRWSIMLVCSAGQH